MPGSDDSTFGSGFHTTRWSVVLAAGDAEPESARASLETLCRTYWYPLYAYARRRGSGAEAASDLTQGFFTSLLARRDFANLDPARGRFRAFLLAALKHYMANERDRERAQKRGGGAVPLSIDVDGADERYGLISQREESPEELFERSWALALLEGVLDGLRASYVERGKVELFDALKGFLTTDDKASLRAIGERLGMTEGAVKVAVHRLRGRYRDELRARVADTVADPVEVDGEIQALFVALGRG